MCLSNDEGMQVPADTERLLDVVDQAVNNSIKYAAILYPGYRQITITLGDAMDGQTLSTGSKKDEGKARWDLLPLEVVEAVARILTRGSIKYAPRNWEKGIAYGRVFAGVMRHLTEFWVCKLFGRDGINHTDGPELHIDHAICGLMFLSAYEKRGMTKFDDRPTPEAK